MLLVPRQLQRAGMTGDVPYYGGRLTPAQAYAISHQPQPPAATSTGTPATTPATMPAPPRPGHLTDNLEALQRLLASGVIDQQEYDSLRARVLA